jgi:hypothetical protein
MRFVKKPKLENEGGSCSNSVIIIAVRYCYTVCTLSNC